MAIRPPGAVSWTRQQFRIVWAPVSPRRARTPWRGGRGPEPIRRRSHGSRAWGSRP